MNQEQAGEILRANVKNLSEPLKSAVEFALMNFFTPSAADLAKKFLASVPYEVFMARDLRETNLELKSKIDAAYFTLMNDENVWLDTRDLPHEEWRDVIGYENEYQISNLGRVKSLKYKTQQILKFTLNDAGYFIVFLYKNDTRKRLRVHRLVGEAFISNPDHKPEVNHRFGNKIDNRLSELEWLTGSENKKHAFQIGLVKGKRGDKHPKSKLSKEDRDIIKKICVLGDKRFGFKALAKIFNVSTCSIRSVYYGLTYKDDTT